MFSLAHRYGSRNLALGVKHLDGLLDVSPDGSKVDQLVSGSGSRCRRLYADLDFSELSARGGVTRHLRVPRFHT